MAIYGGTSSVNGTLTQQILVSAATFDRIQYVIGNAGAATVFVGGTPVGGFSGSTQMNGTWGYPLATGGTLNLFLEAGETLYGWCASGTGDIRYLGITGSR